MMGYPFSLLLHVVHLALQQEIKLLQEQVDHLSHSEAKLRRTASQQDKELQQVTLPFSRRLCISSFVFVSSLGECPTFVTHSLCSSLERICDCPRSWNFVHWR